MQNKSLLAYEESGCGRTAVNQIELAPGEQLPFAGYAEERLYYISDGRGILSVYDPAPAGDVYEPRQVVNSGRFPMAYVLIAAALA